VPIQEEVSFPLTIIGNASTSHCLFRSEWDASAETISLLLAHRPKAAGACDSLGHQPLHIALANASATDDVTMCLLDYSPEGAQMEER